MPKAIVLKLTTAQEAELRQARDHHEKAYVRERAAALLKIAGGMSERGVAKSGLLKPRCAETVCNWVARYRSRGLAELLIKSGRGRKPAFFPSDN